MSKTSEMEAKLRKGPAMLGQAKFHERLKQHVVDLAAEVDDLRAQLAACAAGEWRYDVENAPVHQWLMGSYKGRWSRIRRLGNNQWCDELGVRKTPDAFAVPNPPQVTT